MLYTWSVMVTIFSFQGYLLTTIPLSFPLSFSHPHPSQKKKPEHASHWSATLGHAQVLRLTKTKGLPLTDYPTTFSSRDEAPGTQVRGHKDQGELPIFSGQLTLSDTS